MTQQGRKTNDKHGNVLGVYLQDDLIVGTFPQFALLHLHSQTAHKTEFNSGGNYNTKKGTQNVASNLSLFRKIL